MKKVKLQKDWNGHKAGTILEVDATTLGEILEAKAGSEYDEAAELELAKKNKEAHEALQASIKEAVEGAIKAIPYNEKGINIIVNSQEAANKEGRPFKSLGDQLMAAKASSGKHATIDERLLKVKAASGLNEAVDSDGGFLVQDDFKADLWQLQHSTGLLQSRCETIPISANSNSLRWNALDETSRANGSRQGGVTVYRAHEAALKTASKPTFKQRELRLEKMIGLFYATDELMQDSTALASMVNGWFGNEFGFKTDDEIINGTGVGECLGILNAGCTVSVAEETSQTAATIVAANIEKMYSRMYGPSKPKATWYINTSIWPQLFALQHTVGTGGMPVFLPPGGLSASPYGMLLGRPIMEIEQAAALGTVGDIIFADLSQYRMVEKGGLAADSSIHVQFLYDETVFRFVMRKNGAPTWEKALTPYKGGATATTSPFVTLATRG